MHYIRINIHEYCLRLERGEEIMQTIAIFCRQQKISSGQFQGIGATNNLVIGVYNKKRKNYRYTTLKKSFEITNLIGNISLLNNQPFLHAHINVSDDSLNVIGGHLKSAIISVTGEFFLTKYDKKFARQYDETIGINLLRFK
ncbi:MAG: DNA-binding protein [Mycoplasmataceae bacterium]|nr:DNA-binding protein [Mycoplasmataceae bacterium]